MHVYVECFPYYKINIINSYKTSYGADLESGETEGQCHELVTARWILGNLNSTLRYHLSYCYQPQTSHQTFIISYRSIAIANGDILTSLTIILYQFRTNLIELVSDNLTSAYNNTYTCTNWRCRRNLNNRIYKHNIAIHAFLASDMLSHS